MGFRGKKDLSEFTPEDLAACFPIILREHDPRYAEWYADQARRIRACVNPSSLYRLSHIGSSAVPGLLAKPTVDILLEVREGTDLPELIAALQADGWILMQERYGPEMKLSFNQGYTPDGFAERVYHLHVRWAGDWDELYFRDYLIAHPEAAARYAQLKRELQKPFEHDRDGYTAAKGDFVRKCSAEAKAEFPGRYMPGPDAKRRP